MSVSRPPFLFTTLKNRFGLSNPVTIVKGDSSLRFWTISRLTISVAVAVNALDVYKRKPLNKTFVEIIITSPTIYPNYVYLKFVDFGFSAT